MSNLNYFSPPPLAPGRATMASSGVFRPWSTLTQGGSDAEFYNRNAWANRPLTVDQQLILETAKRNKAAHDAEMLQNLQGVQEDNMAFLAPTAANEARRQEAIQKNAEFQKMLFGALYPNFDQRVKKQKDLLGLQLNEEQLAAAQFANKINPQKFQHDLAKDAFAQAHTGVAEKLANAEFLYRQQHDTAEDQFRKQTQNRADQTQARLDSVAESNRNKLSPSEFGALQKTVSAGEASADQMIGAYPGLTEGQRSLLYAHDKSAQIAADQAAQAAATFNQRLKQNLPVPTPAGAGYFGTSFGATQEIPVTPEEIAAVESRYATAVDRDPTARKQIYWDAEKHQFAPLLRYNAPAGVIQNQSRPAFLRNDLTNSPFQDLPSGPMLNNGGDNSGGGGGEYYGPPEMIGPPATPSGSVSIPVPANRQGSYQQGRVYVINGQNYRYLNGMMVR